MVTSAACEAIDWVDYASVSMAFGDNGADIFEAVATVGATNPLALKADSLQWELGQGPSPEATRGAALVHAASLQGDGRWSEYGRRVLEVGFQSQTSAPLEGDGRVLGVLNLYSLSAQELDASSEGLVRLLAAQATAAVDFALRLVALTDTIESRQIIGQAVGITMARFGLDEAAAFSRLVEESQRTQHKLRVLARTLVEEGNAQAR